MGKVGVCVYIPQINFIFSGRLPNDLSVYYSEAYAILLALKVAKEKSITNFCVISDSLNVLQDIKSSN
jgi:ribonuclease HI